MRVNKTLGIGLVAMLVVGMALVVSSTPWDGVPDDPTPAQAIWVDPKNTTGLALDDVFTVDILINVTDPPGTGTGLYGFSYKLKWNSTVLEAVEIQTHTDNVPAGDLLPGWTSVYVAANATGTRAGEEWHSYAVSATGGVAFRGVASLCTYKFKVQYQPAYPAPYLLGTLDIYDNILVDDTATPIPHTTGDGMYCVRARTQFPVTWKWLDYSGNPVWLTANVNVSSTIPVVNFSFNRSLGQISFNMTAITPGYCNVSIPKLLMDGAFRVLINDTQVPSILTWNKTHTFIYFTYSQGTHDIKIIGEIATRIRGPDLLAVADVNGDGIVNIVDIVVVALRFHWEEDS